MTKMAFSDTSDPLPAVEGRSSSHNELPSAGRVLRLRLTDFRSFADLTIDAAARPVALVGPSGAGKSNVLEALSLLGSGPLVRKAEPDAYQRDGSNAFAGGFGVSAAITSRDGETRLGTGLVRDSLGRRRRAYRIDAENASSAAVHRQFRTLVLAPYMDQLFTQARSSRLDFFDSLVMADEPGLAPRHARFNRARSERQRVLAEQPGELAWLKSLETVLAKEGAAIASARHLWNLALGGWLEAAADLGKGRAITVRFVGEGEDALAGGATQDEVEALFLRSIALSRPADMAAGRALSGAHRTRIDVHLDGKPIEKASTGEQKAALIALLFAAGQVIGQRAAKPVFLLDGIAGYLDARLRAMTGEALNVLGAQFWVTGHDARELAAICPDASTFHIENGRLTELGQR